MARGESLQPFYSEGYVMTTVLSCWPISVKEVASASTGLMVGYIVTTYGRLDRHDILTVGFILKE